MDKSDKKASDLGDAPVVQEGTVRDDDADLAKLGYKSEFRREFGNLSTISFAFSIMGLCSSVTTTFDTPMLYGGGPASVVWCWLIGATMCFTLGTSIAELVSAYPTSGGLYSATAFLLPRKYRSPVAYGVGWLNTLGQIAGVASTEFGLSRMIWAAYAISKGDEAAFVPSTGQVVGLYIGLLCVHGILCSLNTKILAYMTQSFVFFNLIGTLLIIIVLPAKTDVKNSASYVFTNITNNTGWTNDGIAFLFGFLSVQWTMTDYDATAHISEEVKRAAIAAPVAIFVAVIGTGLLGWVLNIILVLCSGDIANLPGNSGLSVATILSTQIGRGGFYAIWVFVCMTAFFVVLTALQANSRTFFAFSRDGALPDRGLFAKLAPNRVPVYGVWIVVIVSALLGLLDFASLVALNAIFSLCTMALDSSYAIPIACKMIFQNHPDVQYRPGPFNLGRGLKAYIINGMAVSWVSFVIVILAFPTVRPVDAENMNYASVITLGVAILAALWYLISARKTYHGPRSNLSEEQLAQIDQIAPVRTATGVNAERASSSEDEKHSQ